MIKKYIPSVVVCAAIIALYTTAFIYSFLNALLLSGLIFFFVLSLILMARLAQAKEINDKLIREIGNLSEQIGKLLVSEKLIYGFLKSQEENKDEEENEKEEAEL